MTAQSALTLPVILVTAAALTILKLTAILLQTNGTVRSEGVAIVCAYRIGKILMHNLRVSVGPDAVTCCLMFLSAGL